MVSIVLGVIFVNYISAPKISYFLADHPFIFMLKANTAIIFGGRCTKPVSGDGNIAPKGVPVKDPDSHSIFIRL